MPERPTRTRPSTHHPRSPQLHSRLSQKNTLRVSQLVRATKHTSRRPLKNTEQAIRDPKANRRRERSCRSANFFVVVELIKTSRHDLRGKERVVVPQV